MDSRKVILSVLVFAFAVSLLVGVLTLTGGDSPSATDSQTPHDGNESSAQSQTATGNNTNDEEQSPDDSFQIEKLTVYNDSATVGSDIHGDLKLNAVGDNTTPDTVTIQLTDERGNEIDRTSTEIEPHYDIVEFWGMTVPALDNESLTVRAALDNASSTVEHSLAVESSVGSDSVVIYPYHQNTSDNRVLDGDTIVITDAAGDEVTRLEDWTADDVRDGLLFVDGLTEDEEYTIEIPEPHGGTWAPESATFVPAETDHVELVAGYEFNSADSFRMVQGEYLDEEYEFETEEEQWWNTRFLARGYANDSDDRWYSKMQRIDESNRQEGYQKVISNGSNYIGGISLGSDYGENDFVVSGEDDGSVDRESTRLGPGASSQDTFNNKNEYLHRFEFVEAVNLDGSAVKDAIEKDRIITDENKILEWIPSITEADDVLSGEETLHKYKYSLDSDAEVDYHYRYINPDTGMLVRIKEPWPSDTETPEYVWYVEYFGHNNVGPEDLSAPILHPDDFELGERYDKADIFE